MTNTPRPSATLAPRAAESHPAPQSIRSQKLTIWPLVVATFFMVSGGTYGTEDVIGGCGFPRGILVLALTPLLWSLPVSLMIGELAAALPAEGGFYAWVRRALGDFWGFQEAWLSLAASVFDMAIYPTLFVTYLAALLPWFGIGHRSLVVALAVVTICTVMNIAGVRAVADTGLSLFVLLTAPFAVIFLLALARLGMFADVPAPGTKTHLGIVAGILVSMWNYMGWDNASTVAGEVAEPQRTYPRAMFAAVGIVAASYILPYAAMWATGIAPEAFETGSWANIAAMLGGPWLRAAVVAGGMISAFGMFNALVMSYSRLPLAMAQDGLLPKAFARTTRAGAPWVAIVALAVAWASCLGIGFERLVTIDILLYGSSLLLEFAALTVLRITAPELPRPFRVPGGVGGTIALAVPVVLLLAFSVVQSRGEQVFGMNALLFGALLGLAGFAAYALRRLRSNFSARAE